MSEKTPLERVEDLLNMKFAELEKRLAEGQRYNESKMDDLKERGTMRDNRLNDHADRIRGLEKKQAAEDQDKKPKPPTTWDKIKDAIIKWIIPFILISIVYYGKHGGK